MPIVTGGGSGGGGTSLLAVVSYNPGTGVVTKSSTSTLTAADTTNLRASFTVPSSGKVLCRLSARCISGSQAGSSNLHLGVLDGATTKGTCLVNGTTPSLVTYESVSIYVTGLTPGAALSYDFAIADSNFASGSHPAILYGFTTSNLVDGTAPAVIEVWQA